MVPAALSRTAVRWYHAPTTATVLDTARTAVLLVESLSCIVNENLLPRDWLYCSQNPLTLVPSWFTAVRHPDKESSRIQAAIVNVPAVSTTAPAVEPAALVPFSWMARPTLPPIQVLFVKVIGRLDGDESAAVLPVPSSNRQVPAAPNSSPPICWTYAT